MNAHCSVAPHPIERQKVGLRDRLDGRSIDIIKKPDGTWKAFIFPAYEPEFGITGVADDPIAALARLVRDLQKLPQ